ncbi:MAG: zf-TFIIB domain-containing protein, partial [Gammaproteobacteria bacterium]|nr:zf-TFIIB domain-containing protein [Gammaproteobacteria bacterium]
PVILDLCPHGHGIWFDDGELDQVVTAKLGAEHGALNRIRSHLSAFEQEADDESPAQESD